MPESQDDGAIVYPVSINNHPLVVGEDDDRSDEALIEAVEERTETAGDFDFPGWAVFVSNPPDEERLRYVNTKGRINVLAPPDRDAHKKRRDVFDEIDDRLDVDGFDQGAMSYMDQIPVDEFDGEIHIDAT